MSGPSLLSLWHSKIKECFEEMFGNKFKNLDDLGKFLEKILFSKRNTQINRNAECHSFLKQIK